MRHQLPNPLASYGAPRPVVRNVSHALPSVPDSTGVARKEFLKPITPGSLRGRTGNACPAMICGGFNHVPFKGIHADRYVMSLSVGCYYPFQHGGEVMLAQSYCLVMNLKKL